MFVQLQSDVPLTGEQLQRFRSLDGVAYVAPLPPVLLILAKGDMLIPFANARAMLAYSAANNLDLADLALVYESAWGG
jgi:hypothetical protein